MARRFSALGTGILSASWIGVDIFSSVSKIVLAVELIFSEELLGSSSELLFWALEVLCWPITGVLLAKVALNESLFFGGC